MCFQVKLGLTHARSRHNYLVLTHDPHKPKMMCPRAPQARAEKKSTFLTAKSQKSTLIYASSSVKGAACFQMKFRQTDAQTRGVGSCFRAHLSSKLEWNVPRASTSGEKLAFLTQTQPRNVRFTPLIGVVIESDCHSKKTHVKLSEIKSLGIFADPASTSFSRQHTTRCVV